jgi:phosphomannomutase
LEEIKAFFKDEKMHFGTAGIRGVMGAGTHKMNIYTYQQMAEGYARYINKHFPKNPSVVIGHDNRINSDLFSLVCANVLTTFGIKVYLFKNNHLTPTPIISFAIRFLNASGGIIVTASHNPKEYNGFKAYNPDGGQVLPDVAAEIEKYMPKNDSLVHNIYVGSAKLLREIDEKVIDVYYQEAKKALVNRDIINFKKPEPIILTTHHGTASNYLPKFLKELNFNVIPVNEQCFVNSEFVNSPSSNPEYFDSFNLSIKLAEKEKSSFLIGVDPDADRMAVMIKHNKK